MGGLGQRAALVEWLRGTGIDLGPLRHSLSCSCCCEHVLPHAMARATADHFCSCCVPAAAVAQLTEVPEEIGLLVNLSRLSLSRCVQQPSSQMVNLTP